MKVDKVKLVIYTILTIGILWQTYQIYQLEQRLDTAEKMGQLKCQKPK